ncbi:class I SAM-dependent methyltransferase [archaeon]|jgi:release factor glutamine methyltransferase|nr:class I SAM-dependent methyltransferase [archaeon]
MNEKPHEITLNFIKDIQTREKRTAEFLGEKIIINKNVFPVDSPFSYSSKMTAKRIPKDSGIVLDVGTGTGVQAIIAAKKGAKKVIAIDIDNNSLENARENVQLHGFEEIIEIRQSNLFENIKKEEKFDLIISQLPFADINYENKVGHFLFDADFKLHDSFLRDAKLHLNVEGKILIPSGEVANEEKLKELIDKYNYSILKVEEELFEGLKWKVYFLSSI